VGVVSVRGGSLANEGDGKKPAGAFGGGTMMENNPQEFQKKAA